MNGASDGLYNLLKKIIQDEFRYIVPRLGQVKDVIDPLQKGRVLAIVPSLGWLTNAQGTWCYSRDKNALLTPKLDDWIMVQWMEGNINKPFYTGIVTEMKDMLPSTFDGLDTTSVIFESPDEKIAMVYDAVTDILTIGKDTFSEAARKEDAIKSTSAEDSTFWTWLTTTLMTTFNTHVHATAAPGPPVVPVPLLAAPPTSITGKITEGSSQVKIGDK